MQENQSPPDELAATSPDRPTPRAPPPEADRPLIAALIGLGILIAGLIFGMAIGLLRAL